MQTAGIHAECPKDRCSRVVAAVNDKARADKKWSASMALAEAAARRASFSVVTAGND